MTALDPIPLPASKSERRRAYAVGPADPGDPADAVLFVGMGAKAESYGVAVTDGRFGGLSVVLAKRTDGTLYEAFVGDAGGGRCTCPGHGRHGNCKHVDALRAAFASGRLADPRHAPGRSE